MQLLLIVILSAVCTVSTQTVPEAVATSNGIQYSFYQKQPSEKLTYDNSKQVCENAGGGLVIIKSSEVQNFITEQLRDLVEPFDNWFSGYWIGGVSGCGPGTWTWEDGSSMEGYNYQNWYDGGGCDLAQPDASHSSYRAYMFSFDAGVYDGKLCSSALGRWADDGNGRWMNWICMKDLCDPNPCVGRSCAATPNGYVCLATSDYSGTNQETNLCSSNPCQLGGICSPQSGGYSCFF